MAEADIETKAHYSEINQDNHRSRSEVSECESCNETTPFDQGFYFTSEGLYELSNRYRKPANCFDLNLLHATFEAAAVRLPWSVNTNCNVSRWMVACS